MGQRESADRVKRQYERLKTRMTLSNPDKKWGGFRLTEYFVDLKKLWALQLTEKHTEDGQTKDAATTVGDVYQNLSGRQTKVGPRLDGIAITTDTGKLEFTGPHFNCDLLEAMLDLQRRGAEALRCRWFYYDWDSCLDNPQEFYRFFVAYDDKIVSENVSFCDALWWGFDPEVFCAADDIKALGRHEQASREAERHYWYRRFYSETKAGQIMTLRNDSPKLYGYPPKPEPEPKPDVAVILLKKIHALLWALVVIGGLLLIRFWR